VDSVAGPDACPVHYGQFLNGGFSRTKEAKDVNKTGISGPVACCCCVCQAIFRSGEFLERRLADMWVVSLQQADET
jgi:hypothetical protein